MYVFNKCWSYRGLLINNCGFKKIFFFQFFSHLCFLKFVSQTITASQRCKKILKKFWKKKLKNFFLSKSGDNTPDTPSERFWGKQGGYLEKIKFLSSEKQGGVSGGGIWSVIPWYQIFVETFVVLRTKFRKFWENIYCVLIGCFRILLYKSTINRNNMKK